MFEHLVTDPRERQQIRNAGWQVVFDQLHLRLLRRGHSQVLLKFYEQATVHFALWSAKRHLHRSQITDGHMARFLSRHLPECCCEIRGVRERNIVQAALWHLKAVLDTGGHRPPCPQKKPTAIDREVDRFDEYLRTVAGLQKTTRALRRQDLTEFLAELFRGKKLVVSSISPAAVTTYISAYARRGTPGRTKEVSSCLRSYFRFLQFHGECDETLALAIPAYAAQRLATLPRVLTNDELNRLVTVFDRRMPVGCRDYAITRCVLDLALRPVEVANLRIEDIDWRKNTIRLVRNKSRRQAVLPLPAMTAKAVADYLFHVRRNTFSRQLFLHINAPVGEGLARQTVSGVIRRAGIRAGINSTIGARTLRQTAATRMLRHGASLKEIADVLRHRYLDTTIIYTKVDLPRLAAVAAPWPKGGGR
jgi:integrase/recombinase XerD